MYKKNTFDDAAFSGVQLSPACFMKTDNFNVGQTIFNNQ
jgi:hypothetical protein